MPACASVRAHRAECASRKKSPTLTGAVFVLTAQALELLQENTHWYGETVSGGLLGGINLENYAPNPISWIDPWGWELVEVNPGKVNYSQRTVSDIRVFDAAKYQPIKVVVVDGQMVSYDNRRLLAAQNAGLEKITVDIVDKNAPHPDSSTGKTWWQKFQERFKDRRNVSAGGVVPETGLREKPTLARKC